MKTYEFTLKFSFPDEDHVDGMDELVERLGEVGCDDALVGTGKAGRLALDFCREAESAFEAVSSAIADVKTAIPDLVNLARELHDVDESLNKEVYRLVS
ncbi:MAG: hypothetical protein F4X31_01355 [Gammaproteobacteria bacterium]|nr:hypothetical protein [Gammaproteobacteria bacterium]MYK83353.1 hypothetical protein [Gammaproteobacteria bacterium]